jgi:hypothetical protein
MAAMAGTIPVVQPFLHFSKEEWILMSYVGEYITSTGAKVEIPGVAYGWEEKEIDYARRTLPQLREFLFKVKEWSQSTVPVFLRDSYRYGKGERVDFEGGLLVRDAFPKNLTNPSVQRFYLERVAHNGYGKSSREYDDDSKDDHRH